ncbi:MAG: crossover junction endodeoxyribonuclease RuvC [Syntrophaceticus schinkii]
MIILGIDPGVISTGYGVIKIEGGKAGLVDCGVIKIDKKHDLPERLSGIYNGVSGVCQHFKPGAVALEEIFFSKNARTAITVGHTRGAVILAAVHQGIEVFSYTPLQIKQTISGYGRADKSQMQRMVQMTLRLQEVPQPDHAADALAAALCHYYIFRTTSKLGHRGSKWGEER